MKAKFLFFAAVLLGAFSAEVYGAESGICPKEPAFQRKNCEVFLEAKRLLGERGQVFLLDTDTNTELHLYLGEGELVLERSYPDRPFFRKGYYFNLKSILARPLLPYSRQTENGEPHPRFEPRGSGETLRFSELEEVHGFLKRSREHRPGKGTLL